MANGDITYTNPGGESSNKAFASGTFIGVAAATNILVGFVPSKIVLINTTNDSMFTWVKGMTAGTMIQQLTTPTFTIETGGPVVYGDTQDDTWDGTGGDSTTDGHGFTIPNTATFNTAADAIVWEAWR